MFTYIMNILVMLIICSLTIVLLCNWANITNRLPSFPHNFIIISKFINVNLKTLSLSISTENYLHTLMGIFSFHYSFHSWNGFAEARIFYCLLSVGSRGIYPSFLCYQTVRRGLRICLPILVKFVASYLPFLSSKGTSYFVVSMFHFN